MLASNGDAINPPSPWPGGRLGRGSPSPGHGPTDCALANPHPADTPLGKGEWVTGHLPFPSCPAAEHNHARHWTRCLSSRTT